MSSGEYAQLLNVMDVIVNVRDYEEKEIPDDVIKNVLTAFSYGPSLANQQPWELFHVQKDDQKERLVEATLDPFLTENSHGGQSWIINAPLIYVVFLEKRRTLARLGNLGQEFAVEDAFCAVQNFRLAAAIQSLSTAVIREFDKAKLKEGLGSAWYLEPIAILTAGYSSAQLELPPRFTPKDFVHKGGWDQ